MGGRRLKEDDIKYILENYAQKGTLACAKYLGCSESTILLWVKKLSINGDYQRYKSDNWTQEDIEILTEQYPLVGADIKLLIAKGYSTYRIRRKARELEIYRGGRHRSWRREEDEVLLKYWDTDKDRVKEILSDRTNSSISARVHILRAKKKENGMIDLDDSKLELSDKEMDLSIVERREREEEIKRMHRIKVLLEKYAQDTKEYNKGYDDIIDNTIKKFYRMSGISITQEKLYRNIPQYAIRKRADELGLLDKCTWRKYEDKVLYLSNVEELLETLYKRSIFDIQDRIKELGLVS